MKVKGELQPLLESYRAWLMSKSGFYRRALRRVSQIGVEQYSSDIETYFAILGGQRSDKQGILPGKVCAHSLRSLDRLDVPEMIVNLQGRKQLISMLSFEVKVTSPPGVRTNIWCKNWIPLAECRDTDGCTTLFVDNDPVPGFSSGRLIEERSEIGWTQGNIKRIVVAESLEGYFLEVADAVARREVDYEEGVGIVSTKRPGCDDNIEKERREKERGQ